MRYRELGELQVSMVGLGCSKLGGDLGAKQTRAVVDEAVDAGVTFFDTADVYGGRGESERLLGEALRGRRDEVVLATKFGFDWDDADGRRGTPPGSRAAVRKAAEGSLMHLGTDRIDLLQYHLPDGVTPIDETLGAMDELVREGKVRCVGCSNLSALQLTEAVEAQRSHGFAPVVSVQNEYSLLHRGIEVAVVPECRRLDVAVIPYFPLASGLLTGKYRRGEPGPPGAPPHARGGPGDEEAYDRLDALAAFAAARGLRPGQVAIGGLAAQPTVVSVIAGATTPEQVRANAAAGAWEPTVADVDELDRIFPRPGAGQTVAPRSRRSRFSSALRRALKR